MEISTQWEFVSDTVMGGRSGGSIDVEEIAGLQATRLRGMVSLENNGGFVQMARDLKADGSAFDASEWAGIELCVLGNDEMYEIRLRTAQLSRPWQSFRAEFVATAEWTALGFGFSDFEAHRTEMTFDPACLRRIGILGIGREFEADVAVSSMRLCGADRLLELQAGRSKTNV